MFVTLWLSLVTAAPTIASDTSSFDYLMSNKFDATRVQSLHLFSAPDNLFFDNGFAPQTSTQDFHEQSELFEAHYSDAARITAERILTKMWVKTSSDPVTMATDIQELAAYIAQQPHAYELLTSLEKQPLRMRYRANDFSTQVRGDHFSVRSVTIHFDPNSAAVLGVSDHCRLDVSHCVASPADAFLHELLHAKIALLETKKFLKSGAMQGMVYPYAHERDVISRERAMYAEMTSVDAKPRPMRNGHGGRLVKAACVTCLEG